MNTNRKTETITAKIRKPRPMFTSSRVASSAIRQEFERWKEIYAYNEPCGGGFRVIRKPLD